MNVHIFLGLVACVGFWFLQKLKLVPQPTQDNACFTDINSVNFGYWDGVIADQKQACLAMRAQDEPAREFLRNAREHLTRAYGELLVAGEDPADLLCDAFKQSWEKTCNLADARFGEIRTTGVLIELGFDRPTLK